MSTQLSPTPVFKAFSNDGKPLVSGLLSTYVAGTSTPQATYQDSTLASPNTNPVILNARGECALWLDPLLSYKFNLTDSLGNQIPGYPVDNIQGQLTANSSIIPTLDNTFTLGNTSFAWANLYLGANHSPAFDVLSGIIAFFPTLSFEVGVVANGYYYGDFRRYGGVGDSGTTDNTTFLQNALTSCAGAFRIYVPTSGYYKITARITAPANTHIVLEGGAELRWTTTTANGTNLLGTATRPGIESVGNNFVIEGNGLITGPSVATYLGNECGILRIGASAASRGTGFVVKDVEMYNWGAFGIVTQFVQDIENRSCKIHDVGYSCITHLSGQHGVIQGNKLYNPTPGTSSNMYCLNLSHDSTNYSSDPNVTSAPRQTVNPFCIDFDVSANEVYGSNWLGLDAHGGYELNFHDNKVYDCYIGVQVSGSSGAAINYAGENNKVCHNTIYATTINGSASTTSGHSGQQIGITLNGGSVLLHRGVQCIGNTIVGCGDTSGAGALAMSIQCSFMQDAVILGNSIRNWYSVGIYGSNFDGTISNNVFTGVGNATLSKMIWQDSTSLKSTINGNRLELHGGTAPLEGIRISSTSSVRPVVCGNYVSDATTPYSGNAALFTAGLSDVVPRIQDATTGSHTLDIGPLAGADQVYVEYTGGGAATLTDVLNPRVGLILAIGVSVNQTLTVNNTGSAFKMAGGTAALTQFGTITFLCVATSNPKFLELGRSLTNT